MSKKIKIEIKHWVTGAVLFEYECENNTIAKTVEEAVKNDANLRSANLGYADLRSANLRSADLGYANLRSADLGSANLRYADLRSAKNADLAIAMTRILPEGDIIGWKKCADGKIAKLRIPTEAKRSHAFGRKCRAEYAEVLEIYRGKRLVKSATSQYDSSFTYKVGETVRPKSKFSEDWTEECASGIHFFITREEALDHDL